MKYVIIFMSIIMCMGSFTLDWNLSKSGQILGWLTLHIKTKFQNKTKTKPSKFFASLHGHFSLTKFFQARYVMKKQTRAKNLWRMYKNLKITLRRGYTELISLKMIYATQLLSYCLMEKIQNVLYKNRQCLFCFF